MHASRPIIAVGADHPLEDEILMADHFRMYPREPYCIDAYTSTDGIDGLAGVHESV